MISGETNVNIKIRSKIFLDIYYHFVVKSGPLFLQYNTSIGDYSKEDQDFSIELSEDMRNNGVDILCYYISEFGEIIYDSIELAENNVIDPIFPASVSFYNT